MTRAGFGDILAALHDLTVMGIVQRDRPPTRGVTAPIARPGTRPDRAVVEAYRSALSTASGIPWRLRHQRNRIAGLWSATDIVYGESAGQAGADGPDRSIGRRTVLSAKFGRAIGRSVCRVALRTALAGHRSVIEKAFARPDTDRSRDGVPTEVLFYLLCPPGGTDAFRVPRLLETVRTDDGHVLILEDLNARGPGAFRRSPFTMSESGMRPIVEAVADFNQSPALGMYAERFPRADLAALYETSKAAGRLAWKSLAARHAAPGMASAGELASGVDRFRRMIGTIAADLGTGPLVLSHNDLANGNILFDGDGRIAFLDFEAVRLAPAGVDIGNLLAFVLRARLSAGSMPSAGEIDAFHHWMLAVYHERSRRSGRSLDPDALLRASSFAFVSRILMAPKSVRAAFKRGRDHTDDASVLLEVLSQMLVRITRTTSARPAD